ncbi:MAG: MotE family protein, partial [Alphaproteobacteria bacterium]
MRIIPITIITAVLFVILKFVDISNNTQEVSKGMLISNVEAQQPEVNTDKEELMKKEEPTEEKKEEAPKESAEGKEEGAAGAEGKDTEKGESEGESEGDGDGEGKENPNVSLELEGSTDRHYSESELDLLKKLGNRRRELARWERNIQIKEEVLNATEKRINDQIGKIEAMRKEVAKLLEEYNEKEDAKIRSLVKIYENMKPKEAARIFDEVEMPVLLLVIDKMSEKKAAPILAQMNPRKAKQ